MGDIRMLCYQLYKMEWMKRISAERQADAYKTWYEEEFYPNFMQIYNPYKGSSEDIYTGMSFDDWILEHGYDGEIYASKMEFFNNEFWDEMYIESILNNEKLYLEYLKEVAV